MSIDMNDALISGILFLCTFLLGISAIEHYLKNTVIPAICWVLLAGITYGAVTRNSELHLPIVHLQPDMVLFIFLPILIFDSSRKIKWTELKSVGLEAGVFATLGVIASIVLIGLPVAWIARIPVTDALLFGAILSATDPIAVTAIFDRFELPEKLRTLIEGESLLNDGTAVILFATLSTTIFENTGFSVGWTVARLILAIGGGVLLGCAFGYVGGMLGRLWHELHDHFIGAILPLITIYTAFVVAEHFLHVSGVITVMAGTLMLTKIHYTAGHANHEARSADQFFNQFWEFLGMLATVTLFFLLGNEIGAHAFNLQLSAVPIFIFILLMARSIVVYLFSGLLRAARRKLPAAWQHVINIGGLKGALSIALILLLPNDYAYRELFLCAAFVLILFTLIGNSLGMRLYLKNDRLVGSP
jgi:CPA1 family monovalent cation:H+ antiporter